jgi:hypothetical protein
VKNHLIHIILFCFLCTNLRGQEISKTDIINDVENYKDGILAKHINPFINISKEDFLKSIEDLKKSSDTINTYQLLAGLIKINASLKDEHTEIDFHQKKFYPILFYFFEEGLIVTKALKEDAEILGTKLFSINDTPIEKITDELKKLTGVSTSTGIKNKIIPMLTDPVILRGLNIISTDEIKYTFLKNESEKITKIYTPADYQKIDVTGLRPKEIPLSASQKEMYWFTYIPESKILFIQYNHCMEDPKKSFKDFHDAVNNSIQESKPEKVIVDLRYNGGGNSNIFRPLINTLSKIPELKGKKIYTLIGRKTYSSAVMNAWQMKSIAHSIMVGEETGGKLNHTGEVKTFTLPKTNFTVYYSSKEWNYDKSQPGGIMPDKEIKYSLKDFLEGIDPGIEYVLNDK